MENKKRDYFDEGHKNIDEKLLKLLTKTSKEDAENLELNLNLMWNLGYQQALLLKDKEQEESSFKLEYMDFELINKEIELIESLSVALQKDDYRDIDVKTTIIKKIIELYNYIYDEMK